MTRCSAAAPRGRKTVSKSHLIEAGLTGLNPTKPNPNPEACGLKMRGEDVLDQIIIGIYFIKTHLIPNLFPWRA